MGVIEVIPDRAVRRMEAWGRGLRIPVKADLGGE